MYTCYSNIKSRQTCFDIDRAIKMLKKIPRQYFKNYFENLKHTTLLIFQTLLIFLLSSTLHSHEQYTIYTCWVHNDIQTIFQHYAYNSLLLFRCVIPVKGANWMPLSTMSLLPTLRVPFSDLPQQRTANRSSSDISEQNDC